MAGDPVSSNLFVPDHVAQHQLVDYDLYHDRRYAEAGSLHGGLFRLAEEAGRGIFWTPRNGGHWFVNDYEMLFEAARNTELFSSEFMTIPPMPRDQEPKLIPLTLDPPDHTKYRLPLMRAFSPDRMRAMEPSIRAFANELIAAIAESGRCDFMEAVAEPLPVVIFMKLMGMDLTRRKEFREWVFAQLGDDTEKRAEAFGKINAMMAELIAARRTQRQEDLISWLLDSEIDGRPVTDEEMQAYCLLLFAAGLDTVANALAFGMDHLARDPDLQDRLRSQPSLIPQAVEELLRRYSIVITFRHVTRNAEFHGAKLKAGERVAMLLPVGNLDPVLFPNPETFDIDRENKVHMAFNAGPHRCAGSHLARIELAVLFEEWLKRMPNVRHDPEKPVKWRVALILALSTVPIVWDPVQVRAAA